MKRIHLFEVEDLGWLPNWMGALGILKAIIWPVILVFHLLKYFNA